MKTKEKTNIAALTGIRAIGAISIALFHFQYVVYESFPKTEYISWILGNGYFAVSMFFILSGFVIELNYGNRKLD